MTQLLRTHSRRLKSFRAKNRTLLQNGFSRNLHLRSVGPSCLPLLNTNWQTSLPRRLKRIAQVGRNLSTLTGCEVPHHLELSEMLSELTPDTQRQAREAYRKFAENPYHPSLRLKKVHAVDPIYSVRISRDYRALGVQLQTRSSGSGSVRTQTMSASCLQRSLKSVR